MTDYWEIYIRANRWVLKHVFGIDETSKNAEEMERKMTESLIRKLRLEQAALKTEQDDVTRRLELAEFKLRVATVVSTMNTTPVKPVRQ
jgi:hypothetical protein